MGRVGDIYRKLHGIGTGKPTNFSWVIPDKIAASGRPTSQIEMDWLRQQGITTVITLTESALPTYIRETRDLKFLHVPIKDHAPPTLSAVDQAVRTIEASVQNGERVLVHCAAGQGRTGTVLAAYLVNTYRLRPSEAIQRIREVRPGSIEEAQVASVEQYAEWLTSKTSKSFP